MNARKFSSACLVRVRPRSARRHPYAEPLESRLLLAAFQPVDDAYVRDGTTYAGTNYGADAELQTKNDSVGYRRETYLKFDVASFGAGPVANARLRLYGSVAGAADAYAVDLHGVTSTTWAEGALTWNNKPAMDAGPLTTATVQGSTNQWYEWDVTPYVQQELANSDGDSLLSLGLKNPVNNATYVRFNSAEAASNKAELVLTPPSQSIVVTVNTLAVAEGGSNTFGVKLAAAPAANVTVTVARQSGGDADLTTATASLTFTPANWNANQLVPVAAAHDADGAAGTASFLLSSPGLTGQTVTATEVDDDVASLAPGDDAYVFGGAATTNYGQDAELRVKGSTSSDVYQRESFLKFPLASVAGVGAATLRVFGRTSTATGSLTVNGHSSANTTWTENTITWTNRPAADTAVLDTETLASTLEQWYEFDVGGFVAAQKTAGAASVTLVLRGPTSSDPYAIFDSDESADPNTRPRLLVTPPATPPPPPPNRAPVANDASFTVPENSADGTAVGTYTATDPDAGQTLAYALTAGNADGAFAIHATTGQITVADGTKLDHEAAPTRALTVTATDNGSPVLSDTGAATISVTDVAEAPAAPSYIEAIAEGISVTVSWNAVAGATTYNLYRAAGTTPIDYNAPYRAGLTGTSYVDTYLAINTTYRYAIRAVNALGAGPASSAESATTGSSPGAPATPSGVWAGVFSATELGLSWDDNGDTETGFRIERSPDGASGWTLVTTVGPDITNHLDGGLSPDNAYHYRVTAYNTSGTSAPSASGSNTTLPAPPAPPTNFSATVISAFRVDLAWAYGGTSDSIDACIVVRSERDPRIEAARLSPEYAEIATVAPNERSFSDVGVTDARRYTYRVRARDRGVDSAASPAQFVVVPPAAPTNLTVTVSGGHAILSWEPGSANTEVGFTVFGTDLLGQWVTPGPDQTLRPNATTTTMPLMNGYTRSFQVRAASWDLPSGYSNIASAPAGPPTADLPHVSLNAAAGSVAEGGSTVVTVRRDPGSPNGSINVSSPLTVALHPPAGTATEGVDYDAVPRSVTIPANAREASFTVAGREDTAYEGPFDPGSGLNVETLELKLKGAPAYAITRLKAALLVDEKYPKVEIVPDWNDDRDMAEDGPLEMLRIGHWGADHNFGTNNSPLWGLDGYRADGTLRNNLGAPNADLNLAWDNFIDRDPDRFYVRVTDAKKNADPNAKERITATIGTVHEFAPQNDDDQTQITLEETGPSTGVFVSASQMLTTMELPLLPGDPPPADPAQYQDDDLAVHDGFAAAGAAGIADDQPGDRTHRTTLEGKVAVKYGANSAEVPVFVKADGSNDERKLLEVRVRVFNEFLDQNGNFRHDGNEPYSEISGDNAPNTVLGTEAQAIAYVDAQIERANVLWSQAGISVRRVGVVSFDNAPNNDNGENVLQDDIINPDEIDDIGAFYANVVDIGTLEVIIGGPLRTNDANEARMGVTLAPALETRRLGEKSIVFLSSDAGRTGAVSPLPSRYNTLAHEIGHALTNVGDVDTPAHVLFQDNDTELDDPLHRRRLSASTSWASRAVRGQGQLKAMGNRLLQPY